MRRTGVSLAIGALVAVTLATAAGAEVNSVRFARQLGLGYLQFYVMQDRALVEKHARQAGLGEIATQWSPLGTPTALVDALLTGSVDFIGVGLPAFLTLWDKTRATLDIKAVVALNCQPAYLNVRNPRVASLRDFTDDDRIALPAPKVSVQAIMLQMMAAKTFGNDKYDVLDRLTVGMSHPDGAVALRLGRSEITAHFTSPPFQYQELEDTGIRKIATSYDATDGPNTFSVAAAASRWRQANPQTYKAVLAAFAEANEFIARDPRETAEIFLKIERVKLPAAFIEKLITDPEFSYAPAPQNVMKIHGFMHRVGALKKMPAAWQELFFPEAHGLDGY
jgi:NitT/TauT family transport system substrate-binding protein